MYSTGLRGGCKDAGQSHGHNSRVALYLHGVSPTEDHGSAPCSAQTIADSEAFPSIIEHAKTKISAPGIYRSSRSCIASSLPTCEHERHDAQSGHRACPFPRSNPCLARDSNAGEVDAKHALEENRPTVAQGCQVGGNHLRERVVVLAGCSMMFAKGCYFGVSVAGYLKSRIP